MAVLPSTGYYVVAAESVSGGGDPLGNYTLSTSSNPFFRLRPVGGNCPAQPIMSPCKIGG